MARSLFSSASVWGSLAMLAMTGSASAQWFPFGGSNSCNCGARPTMMAPFSQSASYSSAYNPVYQTAYTSQAVSCGQPVACTIEQPVQTVAVAQTVRVQALQPVVHPVYDTVQVVEYQPVKQKVQRAVTDTKWVDQAVTEMRPVTEQRTVNVPTVDYQNVTEYKKVQKQVGYYATKTEPVNKVPACAYDNSPGFVGWMNRTGHDIRNSFTPNTKVTRTFVPQTMTCTVPCTKKVAIQGMKQVTYNVTSMVPHQTTRKVAVNSVRYVEEEVTAMKAVTVARTVQVGTRVSYAPVGSNGGVTASGPGNGGSTALQPTPETNSKRTATGDDGNLNPESFTPNKKISYPVRERESDRGEVTETVIPSRPAMKAPSVVRVSQWVARAPSPSPSVPALDTTASMSIAGTVR